MKMPSKVFSAVSSIAATHLQPTTKDYKQKLTAHPMDLRKLLYHLRLQNIFKCNTDTVSSNLLGEYSWYKSSLISKSTSVFFYKSCLKLHITLDEQPICTRSLIKLVPIWIQVWERTFPLNLAQLFC